MALVGLRLSLPMLSRLVLLSMPFVSTEPVRRDVQSERVRRNEWAFCLGVLGLTMIEFLMLLMWILRVKLKRR